MSQSKLNQFFPKRPRINETSIETDQEESFAAANSNKSKNKFQNTSSVSTSVISDTTFSKKDDLGQENPKIVRSKALDLGNFYLSPAAESLWKDILEEKWVPENSFKFPPNSTKRKFQSDWLKQFRWLSYSESLDGAFCRYCVIFATKHSVGATGKQQTGKLVQKPHSDWKHAKDDFAIHEKTQFHLESVKSAECFLNIGFGNESTIVDKLDSSVLEQNKKVKVILVPVIETILLCGLQNLALRGQTDHGRLEFETPATNDGNFRELLRMRIKSGDEKLRKYFESASLNATYCSPKIQNEIIQILGSHIQHSLVERVNKSKCFSLIADETADVAGVEQLSICLRYVEKINGNHSIREDFITFAPLVGGSAEAIAEKILLELTSLQINLKYLFGQGYDGCSTMKGKINGVQARIRKLTSESALFVHCSSHSLNLALTDSCGIPDIRNALQIANEVISFLRRSPKRLDALRQTIIDEYPENFARLKLISYCETRFVERHSSILRFVQLFPAITSCLEKLELESDRETSSKAQQLGTSITTSRFIVGSLILEQILSHTMNLSRQLQSPQLDLVAALEMVDHTTERLTALRTDSEAEFKLIFTKAQRMAESHSVEIVKPRTTKRQTYRNNVNAETAEEYYRKAFYLPFIDSVVGSLKSRFLDHKMTLAALQSIVPAYAKQSISVQNTLYELYGDEFADSKIVVENEISIWIQKWSKVNQSNRPDSALSALDVCDPDFFPSVYKLLTILATLPVSTCSAERSFSTLKRLKTYLRNTMGENRLNGLALLSVFRDIEINISNVIQEFMCSKNRRIAHS